MKRSVITGMPAVHSDFETELGQLIAKHKPTVGVDAILEGLDLFILTVSLTQDVGAEPVKAPLPGHD